MAKKQKAEVKERPLQKDAELFDTLHAMVEDAENNSSTWRDNTDTWYKLRARNKKTKTFPFVGCSNLRLPTIETYVRKAKAALLGIYMNVKPRMTIVPQSDANLEKARRIEKFMDWICDTKIKLFEKLVVIVDKMLEQGFCLAKVVWKMEEVCYTETISVNDLSEQERAALLDPNIPDEALLEFAVKKFNIDQSESVLADNLESLQKAITELRSGKESVKVNLKDELYNAPDVVIAEGVYVGVPTDSGRNPQDCRMIYHEYFEPWDLVKQRADYGTYEKDAVDNIEFVKSADIKDYKLLLNSKDAKEGIDRLNNPSKMLRLIDLYCYYDLDGDKKDEKCHFLLAPDFKQVIKKQGLENDSQKWPFVKFEAEITDNRWYSSRGYPQHLEDISKEIDAQHNQKLDNQTIRNAPMFVFRSGVVNPRLVKFIPGQGIPVPGMTPLTDAIQVLNNNNPNVEFSYEREELLLKSNIQEYLGQMDYSVQSMINKRQPRTLGEVQMQAQSANTVFALDVNIFTSALTELFDQILEFSQQYMPERVFALITGDNGVEPLHLTRDEIQGKYDIIVRGNDLNSNPMLRAQKSLARVQLLLSPIPLQMGIVTPINAYNAIKRYLQDDGELAWKELLSQPQPPKPPSAAGVIKPDFKSLTDMEQAQVLSQTGIQPDMMGRELKSRAIIDEKQREQDTTDVEEFSKVMDAMSSMNEGEDIGGEEKIGG
jgi:hypothetical protein